MPNACQSSAAPMFQKILCQYIPISSKLCENESLGIICADVQRNQHFCMLSNVCGATHFESKLFIVLLEYWQEIVMIVNLFFILFHNLQMSMKLD